MYMILVVALAVFNQMDLRWCRDNIHSGGFP